MPEKNQVFDKIGSPALFSSLLGNSAVLRYRLGVSFLADGEQPYNIEGTIPHMAGSDVKVRKFYLPPHAVDLAQVGRVEYPVPGGVHNAPFGELVLNDREGCYTMFGRFEEESPFSFGLKRFIFLRVNREEEGGFVPLFMGTQKDGALFYRKLEVDWFDRTIVVTLTEVESEDLPPCFST